MSKGNRMADPTDIEKKSLEAHVELCAERYRSLELKVSDVRNDIASVKGVLQETHELVHNMSDKRNSQLIQWGSSLILVLIGSVGYLLSTYVIK